MSRNRTTGFITVAMLTVALSYSVAPAGFTPPKDKLLTEKQLTGYIEIMKQYIVDQKAAQKASEGQSGLANLALAKQLLDRQKAAIAAHGMTEEEFNWVATEITTDKAASLQDQVKAKMKADIDKQLKANAEKLATMKTTLADYQKSQQFGRRIMTADERKSAIDSATEDQKSALDEAKQHADEAKAAQADVDKADADQKAAETALKNPPKFDSDDDKNNFIQDKQNAIQSAKDARKEATDKVAEAKKAEAESRAKAASAAARMKDPDLPAADEDKAALKQQNEEKIKQLSDDIKQTEEGNKLVQDSASQQIKIFADEKNRPPEQNMVLFKKHEKEYDAVFGFTDVK